MQIDPTTLMFTSIPENMTREMYLYADSIVIKGEFPQPEPEWVTRWLAVGNFADSYRIVAMSTILPLRIAMSLLRHDGYC